MKVDGPLLKDLDIFQAVVKCNGISNAQYLLNKDSSTISRAISSLETRVGLVLCERGRSGFKLTEQGQQLLYEYKRLSLACTHFERRISELGGSHAANLKLGVIDNIISDPQCPLLSIMRYLEVEETKQPMSIDLVVNTPYELERGILDQTLDAALGIFESKHDTLEYHTVYEEVDYLYASTTSSVSPLIKQFHNLNDAVDTLMEQNFCARNFLNQNDINALGFNVTGDIIYAENLEAIIFKILSGSCIGFIPAHYAQKYVQGRRTSPDSAKSYIKNITYLSCG